MSNPSGRRRLESVESSDYEQPFEDETEKILGAENDENEDDTDGEELINDNMERDYRPIPELDVYEEAGLDDNTDLEELSLSERHIVEEQLAKRDKAEALASGNLRRELIPDFFDEESSDVDATFRRQRMADKLASYDSIRENFESQTFETIENLEDTKGMSVANWIQQPATRQEIKNRFLNFLRTFFSEDGNSVYAERITTMAQENGRSLIIDYGHLVSTEQVLAYFVPEAPRQMLEIFDEVAYEVTLSRYPRYRQITDKIHVRISHLPLIEEIRSLRQIHMNQLIRTSGVVSSCTNVMPKLSVVQYNCVKCSCTIGPFLQSESNQELKPSCPDCQSRGPFEINNEKTIYKNYQRITIQESPGTVPSGRLPRSKDAILLDDMVDSCKPGDEIDVTGTYKMLYDPFLNRKHGFPVFFTHILVNNIVKKDEQMILSGLTDEDIKTIQNLAKDERLFERIVHSIAPSIYGHEDIKRAIALSLFGGVPKVKGQRLRGDINVLLCGDPGTGKSQILKFVEQIAPRCVFSTGQGASAVGLTAYVTKNATTKEWTLEAGALVLADKGVCLIDEFDKMNDQDRTSIHEAMEQQSISISKAGIVTSLQARSTIIAAANPIGGRYDPSRNFSDNVDLSSPILSRFDILCVIRDVVDPIQDEMMAKFIIGSHMRHHSRLTNDEHREIVARLESLGAMNNASDSRDGGISGPVERIPLDLLRKYIIYAKQRIHPSLNQNNEHKLTSVYVDLRRASQQSGGIDVTVRYFESLIRLSEAHAKLHLREVVKDEDVNMAIRNLLVSFISTEKYSVMKQLENKFRHYLNYKRNDHELLMFLLKQLLQNKLRLQRPQADSWVIEVSEKSLQEKANRLNIPNIKGFLNSSFLRQQNFHYDASKNTIFYTF